MRFLNKKAVEALPLRYIIIALVAALVVGIALQMTGTLQSGIQGTAEKLNESVSEKVACELDFEDPVIEDIVYTNDTAGELTVDVDITEDCGVETVIAYFDDGIGSDKSEELELDSGTETDGTWSGTITGLDDGLGDLRVWVKDKSTSENDETEIIENIDII